MITYEEYINAVNELVKMGINNKYGLSYFETKEETEKASKLKSIMYSYERENEKKEVKTKRLSNR